MCGIAGYFHAPGAPSVGRHVLASMTDVIAHRGPDGRGEYADATVGIGLGHRRLSIIDVAAGAQPLSNEDGTVWVVFNGEIYNFQAIREDLERAGHRFRTRSDTEVIVHGYEEWGLRVVERFRGMFAFALWDARQRRLVLGRDRLGIKPLYYAALPDGSLVFGSEIKAVLEHPRVPRQWSAEALDAYLALQYVPTPHTIFEHIRKLPPAHLLVAHNGSHRLEEYWTLSFTGDGDAQRESAYLSRLDQVLHEAVKLRLISEVPLGAFLSGGIDSSAVVSAMVDTADAPVLTTSVGFQERSFNEAGFAEQVATHLGCGHYTRTVTPQIADLLPRLAWHLDEPFADASAVPTYYVSAVAREKVTVALSGDGGDELWAGYARHRVERLETQARRWLGQTVSHAASRVGQLLPLSVKGTRSLRHLGLSPDEACAQKHVYGLFEQGVRDRLYTADFADRVRQHDPLAGFRRAYAACGSPSPVDRALFVDVRTYLLDDILVKVDKMSMAVALETRVPLLDHKLVEFAASVPISLKLRGGRGKYLLRTLLRGRIPDEVLERPKHGFEAPTGQWLRGPLAPMVSDLLLGPTFRARQIFSPASVARLWREHQSGRRDHRHRLWSLLMLELWFRQFIDRSASVVHAATA